LEGAYVYSSRKERTSNPQINPSSSSQTLSSWVSFFPCSS
jgi:hypothetical protein